MYRRLTLFSREEFLWLSCTLVNETGDTFGTISLLEVDGMGAGETGECGYVRPASSSIREKDGLCPKCFRFGINGFDELLKLLGLVVVEPFYTDTYLTLFVGFHGVVWI